MISCNDQIRNRIHDVDLIMQRNQIYVQSPVVLMDEVCKILDLYMGVYLQYITIWYRMYTENILHRTRNIYTYDIRVDSSMDKDLTVQGHHKIFARVITHR